MQGLVDFREFTLKSNNFKATEEHLIKVTERESEREIIESVFF